MLKEERLNLIMREINIHNKVMSLELSRLLNVSEDTVRRDLKELVESGKVLKVHGGAISKSLVTPLIEDTQVYAQAAKQKIAEKAAQLLRNDMVVITEGGTTMLEWAKSIPKKLRLTVFTISPQVAITLSAHTNLQVITIGGQLKKKANLHVGAYVLNQLADLKVDLCLLGANGFSVEEGLTDVDWEIVQVKKALIRCAQEVALLAISEKMHTTQKITICGPDKIDYLVTELDADDPSLAAFRGQNLKLL